MPMGEGPNPGEHVVLSPEEGAEYRRTGKMPESALRRMAARRAAFLLRQAIEEGEESAA